MSCDIEITTSKPVRGRFVVCSRCWEKRNTALSPICPGCGPDAERDMRALAHALMDRIPAARGAARARLLDRLEAIVVALYPARSLRRLGLTSGPWGAV